MPQPASVTTNPFTRRFLTHASLTCRHCLVALQKKEKIINSCYDDGVNHEMSMLNFRQYYCMLANACKGNNLNTFESSHIVKQFLCKTASKSFTML